MFQNILTILKAAVFSKHVKTEYTGEATAVKTPFSELPLIKVSQYILDYALESKGLFFFLCVPLLQTKKEICIGIKIPLILFYCSSSKYHISYTSYFYEPY